MIGSSGWQKQTAVWAGSEREVSQDRADDDGLRADPFLGTLGGGRHSLSAQQRRAVAHHALLHLSVASTPRLPQ